MKSTLVKRLVIGSSIGLTALFIVLAIGAFSPRLSSTGFCISCHEMTISYEEYKQSSHFASASGVRAECSSCHIPEAFFPKLASKTQNVREVVAHFRGVLDSEEKYEKERLRMAKKVWEHLQQNDSAECRSCHVEDAFVYESFKDQEGALQMQDGLKEKQTCIDCHKGMVHDMPDMSSGYVLLFEQLQEQSQDSNIKSGTVYPLQTVLCYDEIDGRKDGRILPATALTILEDQDDWLKVRAEGYRQDGVTAMIYAMEGKRIFSVALGKSAREKPDLISTKEDPDTGLTWHQVEFETWIKQEHLVSDLEQLWEYGAELHNATCGICHSPTPADHYLANQWIGGIKYKKEFISVSKEEYRFLQKYLQLHAPDVTGFHH